MIACAVHGKLNLHGLGDQNLCSVLIRHHKSHQLFTVVGVCARKDAAGVTGAKEKNFDSSFSHIANYIGENV